MWKAALQSDRCTAHTCHLIYPFFCLLLLIQGYPSPSHSESYYNDPSLWLLPPFSLQLKLCFFTLSHQRKTSSSSLASSYLPYSFTYTDSRLPSFAVTSLRIIEFSNIASKPKPFYCFPSNPCWNLDKSQAAGGLTLPRAPNIPATSLLLVSSSVIFFQREHTFVGEWPIFNFTHQDFLHCLWLWLVGTMQTLAQKCIISKSTRQGFYSSFSITIGLGIQEVSLLLVTCLNFQGSIIHTSAKFSE